jgi:hypothetical protein
MPVVAFDSLEYTSQLEAAGMPRARALVQMLTNAILYETTRAHR